jgi:hypothetical protein
MGTNVNISTMDTGNINIEMLKIPLSRLFTGGNMPYITHNNTGGSRLKIKPSDSVILPIRCIVLS